MAGWFDMWFGPGVEGSGGGSSSVTPPVQVVSTFESSDPAVVDHLAEALDRLCEQFRGD